MPRGHQKEADEISAIAHDLCVGLQEALGQSDDWLSRLLYQVGADLLNSAIITHTTPVVTQLK